MNLDSKIEAILYYKGEPVSIKELGKILSVTEKEVKEGIETLRLKLQGRGVALVQTDADVMLGTAPELSSLLDKLIKDERAADLSKASVETLAIVLYQGPIGKQDIDFIRGVNSGYILRSLSIRGLVERVENAKDRRGFLYKPTLDLLANLGVSKIADLPDFEKIKVDIEKGKQSFSDESTKSPDVKEDTSDAVTEVTPTLNDGASA